jgi:hypothetical protein
MVYPSAGPELVDRLAHGLLMRGRHKYYPRLGDERSGQL